MTAHVLAASALGVSLTVTAVFAQKEVRLGAVALALPDPPGLIVVPDSAKEFHQAVARFVYADNAQLAVFVTETDLPSALAGGQAPLVRYALVQTNKRAIDRLVSQEEFNQVKALIADQNSKVYAGLDQKIRGLFDEINQRKRPIDADVTVDALVPLPPHASDASSLAFSMFARTTIGAGKDAKTDATAVTATFVRVRSKILYLYVYGNRNDLDWTRATAAEWTKKVLDANRQLSAGN
jgi:hypothetical protein